MSSKYNMIRVQNSVIQYLTRLVHAIAYITPYIIKPHRFKLSIGNFDRNCEEGAYLVILDIANLR